ncbi:lipase [Subtercola boreus]|uniref:Lipase n=1 Tax=Subtercola boreus TaxID=120213 RepID=A0A3E0VK67_9MICO|nr:alpha/beta hydrolase fold domain-containing protein [Subtercola boreus]RFA09810.1 lipase [Subtercola boreus]TQL53072.1 acetyl esterase/lipase [Subtercola boreus]
MTSTDSVREFARPPYDPELAAVLAVLGAQMPPTVTPGMIAPMRSASVTPPIEELLAGRAVTHEERSVPGPEGAPEIILSIFRRTDHVAGGPGIYNVHGGGMIIGDRFTGLEPLLDWVEQFDAVLVSVEYRLAPESPDPALVDDCYAGLVWTAEHADELGFNADRLVISGGSAGGGIAAGVTLMARDKGGPALIGSLLMYPMLDDRNETVSSHQFVGIGVWDRGSNDTGWDALLGDRRGTENVSIYAAPARATDLSGLPPTFIDVGSAEVFRDEDVAYASKIWADGGICELHVTPGVFHGAELMAPAAALSTAVAENRTRWLRRILGV